MNVRKFYFEPTVFGLESVLHDESTVEIREHTLNAMRLSMRAHVWERYLESAIVEQPRTWWDAVKLRFLPAWALRRWPPQMVVAEMHAVEAVANRALPPGESVVAVMVFQK